MISKWLHDNGTQCTDSSFHESLYIDPCHLMISRSAHPYRWALSMSASRPPSHTSSLPQMRSGRRSQSQIHSSIPSGIRHFTIFSSNGRTRITSHRQLQASVCSFTGSGLHMNSSIIGPPNHRRNLTIDLIQPTWLSLRVRLLIRYWVPD